MLPRTMDLNADVGERPEAIRDGSEEALVRLLSSASIACGGHAGDDESMRTIVRACMHCGVAVGAHPSYPDRENFGRKEMALSPADLESCVHEQVARLLDIASAEGAQVRYVKPHGALYNTAARRPETAAAIAEGVRRACPGLVLVGLAGSSMLHVWRRKGFATAAEAFADRRYERDGSLRARTLADALITEPEAAAAQALQIAQSGSVLSVEGISVPVVAQTICVHSDTPGSLRILRRIREALETAGLAIQQFAGQAAEPRNP